MKYFVVLILSFLLAAPLMAQDKTSPNLSVQGTIVVGKKSKLPNSAIVNQQPVWEGKIYTYIAKTGKLLPRAKRDSEEGLPSVTVDLVENGKVTFTYKNGSEKNTFSKNIKKSAK